MKTNGTLTNKATKGINLAEISHALYSQFRLPQTNSAFHPSRVSKQVVIHVITWITGAETIKRQSRAAYGRLVIGQSVVTGLAYGL